MALDYNSLSAKEKNALKQQGQRFTWLRETHFKQSREEFAERIGGLLYKGKRKPYDMGTLSKIEGGKLPVPQKLLIELSSKFGVSQDWLLTGEATPFVHSQIVSSPEAPHTEGGFMRQHKAFGDEERRKVPILGEAKAGNDEEMNLTPAAYIDEYIDVGDLLRDSEAAFTVYGNSMTPNYPAGSVLGLRRNYDGFIQPGEVYLLETKSNRLFKRLYWNADKTGYLCYSDNNMKHESGPLEGKYFYEMFEIPLFEVIRIFDVTGMIKRLRNSGIMSRRG